jgi:rhamnosyltransferase
VLDGGWLKAYAGRACVVHSNDLTRAEYGHRIFDETVGLRQIGTTVPPLSRRAQLKLTVRGVLGDSFRIARDREFTTRARLSWLVRNPAYQARKWSSYRSATQVDLNDSVAVAAGSLESRRAASGS